MSQTVVLPQGTYPPNTYNLGPASIPQGIGRVEMSFDGTNMTSTALKVSLLIDISLDGGATWASTSRGPDKDPFPIQANFQGGAQDFHGGPLATYRIAAPIPSPDSATRQAKATAIVSGASLTTSGTLTLT